MGKYVTDIMNTKAQAARKDLEWVEDQAVRDEILRATHEVEEELQPYFAYDIRRACTPDMVYMANDMICVTFSWIMGAKDMLMDHPDTAIGSMLDLDLEISRTIGRVKVTFSVYAKLDEDEKQTLRDIGKVVTQTSTHEAALCGIN